MTDDAKKLILGLISGLSLAQIKPFFLSLEKSGYRGEVCMLVSDLGVATQAFLRSRRVQLVPFQKAFLKSFPAFMARLPGLVLSRRRQAPFARLLAPAYMHPRCARYFFYQSCVQEFGGGYSHIMLTDVRDVVFQTNPFAFELPGGLSVFLEDRTRNLGACEPLSRTVSQVFGQAVSRAMSDKPIVSTGVTVGTTTSMREYLAQLTRILCEKKERRPVDQAVHNYLAHQEPPANLRCFENACGPVLTMGEVAPDRFQFNDQDQIITSAGQVVNTLHQYDRQPELAQKLLKRLT